MHLFPKIHYVCPIKIIVMSTRIENTTSLYFIATMGMMMRMLMRMGK